MKKSKNAVWHPTSVTREMRNQKNGHRSVVLWFTGLSGSGKSTIAHAIEEQLYQQSIQSYVLDGDNVRHGLCGDLTFSEADRHENIRRIGEVTKLLLEAGLIVMTAFISPFRADRESVRKLVGDENFLEIYCQASLDVCEQRDVKGLYKKARAGLIENYTGISSPYEVPENPDLVIDTEIMSLEDSVDLILEYLKMNNLIKANSKQVRAI